MQSRHFYLLERFDPAVDYSGGQILALTPLACFELDKKSIKYKIIDDYCSHQDLSCQEAGYQSSLLAWVNDFDKFLEDNIPALRLFPMRPLRSFYKFIEISLGGIFIRAYHLRRFLEQGKASSITYIYDKNRDIDPVHGFAIVERSRRERFKSLYLQLIPLICAKYSVDLEIRGASVSDAGLESGKQEMNQGTSFKERIKGNRYLSWIYLIYQQLSSILRYRTLRLLTGSSGGTKKLGILIMRFAPGLEDFIEKSLTDGHRIFLKQGCWLKEITPFGIRSRLLLKKVDQLKHSSLLGDCLRTAKLFEANPKLINWVNTRCGFDVSGLIMPKLKDFITEVCPEFINNTMEGASFYDRNQIDFVVSMYEVEISDFAMIAATRGSRATKSVHLQHGESIYPISTLGEFDHFDYYFASEEGMEWDQSRISGIKKLNPCSVYRATYRLKDLKELRESAKKETGCSGKTKEKIVYVPRIAAWDRCYYNVPSYSVTWHYKFQKKLIEHFAKRSEFDFIWKGAPAYDNIYSPIPQLISESGFTNVEVSTLPLTKCLAWADRVINDFLSSCVYETTSGGVPMLALRYRGFEPRDKRVLDIFGNTVTDFNTTDEAIEKIDKFLSADPKGFTIDLPLDNNDMLCVLKRLRNGQ